MKEVICLYLVMISIQNPKTSFCVAGQPEAAAKEKEKPAQLRSGRLSPVAPAGHLEFWDPKNELRFVHIAAMYSELVAIGNDGKLYQWRWAFAAPTDGLHPKFSALRLEGEKIIQITAAQIRTTFITESNKAGSFMDEILGPEVAKSLDFPAMEFTSSIAGAYTCPMYSVLSFKDNGPLSWWGVIPFPVRKKQWERSKACQGRTKKHVTFDDSSITVGSQVNTYY